MDRREFLFSSAAAGIAAPASKNAVPKRPYKPGVDLSIIGFGGIVVCGQEQKAADREVAQAIDRGVNYFDVAPTYFDGEAENKLGIALKTRRKGVFLACKTGKRDAAGSRAELEQSLKRLNTDHFDLYQLHAVSNPLEVEELMDPGGALETLDKAKKEGKIRFLGVSVHNAQIGVYLMDTYPFDSILFPVNYTTWEKNYFGPQIMAKAKQIGVSRLALKSLAQGRLPENTKSESTKYPKCWYQPIDDPELAALALRWTLNQDITAAIPPGDERLFHMALDIASGPIPALNTAELKRLYDATTTATPLFSA
jgi:aryl-alcohol dehydrogenase-like predicted oxidoreductase